MTMKMMMIMTMIMQFHITDHPGMHSHCQLGWLSLVQV